MPKPKSHSNVQQIQIEKYKAKYGIDIAVVDLTDLSSKLKELKSNIKEPTYMSVIVEHNTHNDNHQTAVLCYFSGKPDSGNQFIIAESYDQEYTDRILKEFEDAGGANDHFAVTTKPRQGDTFSCRMTSMLTSRNALLEIKHNKQTGGFGKSLREGSMVKDQRSERNYILSQGHRRLRTGDDRFSNSKMHSNISYISELPPLWNYTDQISNKREARGEGDTVGETKLIRHAAHSATNQNRAPNEGKGSIAAFRRKNTTVGNKQVMVVLDFKEKIPKGKLEKIMAMNGNGVEIQAHEDQIRILYSDKYERNDYMVKKAAKLRSDLVQGASPDEHQYKVYKENEAKRAKEAKAAKAQGPNAKP